MFVSNTFQRLKESLRKTTNIYYYSCKESLKLKSFFFAENRNFKIDFKLFAKLCINKIHNLKK